MPDGSPSYDRPPVTRTTLSVYVEPIENFDLSMILPLQKRWSEKFPALAQAYPSRRPAELPEASSFGGSWPLPAVEQLDGSLSRTLRYQHDQLSLEWVFDLEAADSAYPGFDVLSAELSTAFTYFVEVVQRFGDKPLTVQGCRCFYENRLDVTAEDWLVGFLASWRTASDATARFDDAAYVGFRLREHSENSVLGTTRIARSELDAGRALGATGLDIDVLSVGLPDSPVIVENSPSEAARLLLDDAHSLLIDTFAKSASDEMRAKWGMRQ